MSLASLHTAAEWLRREVATFDLLDWVLLGAGVGIVALAWCWQLGRVRLGTVHVKSVPETGENALEPYQVAALNVALCETGLVPPGAVPAGSPKPDVVAAVAAAPVSEAKWLGALINAIPFPSTSMSYLVNVTARPAVAHDGCGVSYALMRANSRDALTVRTVRARSVDDALGTLATDIYCAIARHTPDIYPPWSQWPVVQALSRYRSGLAKQAANQPGAAVTDYEAARRLAPQNMLVRLRIANERERRPGVLSPRNAPEACLTLAVLEEYLDITECEADVYEAHYRAGVLLALLADRLNDWRREADGRPAARAAAIAKRLRRVLVAHGCDVPDERPAAVIEAARGRSRAHSRSAKWRLQPWWALAHFRLRNRYELRGARRREARRARAVSRLCLAMRAQPFYADSDAVPGGFHELFRTALRLWLRVGYVAFRWRRLGWQAHYNAACFYALTPELVKGGAGDRAFLAERAYKHLAYAAKTAGANLSSSYVRYEDPDLDYLRRAPGWNEKMDLLYGRAAVVHYRRPDADYDGWGLHVWVEGGADVTTWADPVPFTARDRYGVIFSVPISDLSGPLGCVPHRGADKDCDRSFGIAPHALPEVWLCEADPVAHASAPERAS